MVYWEGETGEVSLVIESPEDEGGSAVDRGASGNRLCLVVIAIDSKAGIGGGWMFGLFDTESRYG